MLMRNRHGNWTKDRILAWFLQRLDREERLIPISDFEELKNELRKVYCVMKGEGIVKYAGANYYFRMDFCFNFIQISNLFINQKAFLEDSVFPQLASFVTRASLKP